MILCFLSQIQSRLHLCVFKVNWGLCADATDFQLKARFSHLFFLAGPSMNKMKQFNGIDIEISQLSIVISIKVLQNKRTNVRLMCRNLSNKTFRTKIECKISIYHSWYDAVLIFLSEWYIRMSISLGTWSFSLSSPHFHFSRTSTFLPLNRSFIHVRKYSYWDVLSNGIRGIYPDFSFTAIIS